jgi:hypothetical protein
VERALFDTVQAQLDEQRIATNGLRRSSQALLAGKLVDDRGYRMTPSHARKKGIRYGYYVSNTLVQGRPAEAGSQPRVAALPLEAHVTGVLRAQCLDAAHLDNREMVEKHLQRCQISSSELTISYWPDTPQHEADQSDGDTPRPITVSVPWTPQVSRRVRQVLIPRSTQSDPLPLNAGARSKLVRAIARGRRWLDDIVEGRVESVQAIASREGCTGRSVMQTLSLAFVSPDLVTAAVAGRLPQGIGFARLAEPPMEWSQQITRLGL